MPAFDDDALAACAEIDAVFGEVFVVRPYGRANPNGVAAPDPARAVLTLTGVWKTKPADPREPHAYDSREPRRPGIESVLPHVEFSPAAFTVFPGFEIRSGDQIERSSSAMVYEARAATFSANGVMSVPLNLLGPRT